MKQIHDIFGEYSRMRDNGLDAKAALNVLRPHIDSLGKAEREHLATMVRARETQAINNQPAPEPQSRNPVIKPLRPAPAPAAAPEPSPVNVPLAEEEIVWVTCPDCGKANQRHEVFCYACGHLLEPVRGVYDTRVLSDQANQGLDSEFFGRDTVLVLRIRGSSDVYELRPQGSKHELVVGRSAKGSVLAPDVDLSAKQGENLGVSRMHLSIRYDAEHSTVLAADLGSSNGSFINGQKMLPKEVRVLRHGDEIRLGRLPLMVSFRHPS